MGRFRVSAATLEVSDASKVGHEMTTTPLKNVPSALKSVSLIVVRGGVAPNFEPSARTHSRYGSRRNIQPPGKSRIPAPGYSGLTSTKQPSDARKPINFRPGKDFGRRNFSGRSVTRL